ncbi:Bol3p RNJ42_00876 [Nakaseomyces bracarensis]|uniref:Bol3p n=1 Tax=Nakaseomyces bracarensis TaxID=273131 RepID=UPI003871ECF2
MFNRALLQSRVAVNVPTRTIAVPLVSATKNTHWGTKFSPVRWYSSSDPTPEEARIHKKLVDAFETQEVRVQDVSGGCGSMYAIHITSPKFNSLTTIKQHQMVNEILKEDIPKWHGLQLRTMKKK